MHKWILTDKQRCDLELLLNGGFHPLTGFLSQADYESVLHHYRLSNHTLWPIPITLDITDALAENIRCGDQITLCDTDNTPLASMRITDKWKPNKILEAQLIFGTENLEHPGVYHLLKQSHDFYIGGRVQLIQAPKHYDFLALRHTPAQLKQLLSRHENIVGFQTRNPLHRAHMALTIAAAAQINAHILLHPTVGMTKPGDIDYVTRVQCYQKIMPYYSHNTATLSLLPLAMRMAGPREALWHALIRKNHGCTHFIVGRDHAGPGKNSSGQAFYDPLSAQRFAKKHEDEMDINIIPFEEMIYVFERKQYCLASEIKQTETPLSISGTQLRHALQTEQTLPDWFSFPEVIEILSQSYVPKHKKGFTVFFTGLSGAGKTTLATALHHKLIALGKRNSTVLDGDQLRPILSSELGFSKTDRNLHIHRMGLLAAEITKVGGIALCAAIAPYDSARARNRALISQYGGYIEVHVSTSLAVCEKRDVKALYQKAREGQLLGFTGISDPYETPINPDITINTEVIALNVSVDMIIDFLILAGYLVSTPGSTAKDSCAGALATIDNA